ncbi:MAG: hypothetical protein BCS36_03760 [Desulfovibrio sp. MES5]|nr:MAG: hypothetical protein BCS36_03760 [Desulfovibrio sp. MES5]
MVIGGVQTRWWGGLAGSGKKGWIVGAFFARIGRLSGGTRGKPKGPGQLGIRRQNGNRRQCDIPVSVR